MFALYLKRSTYVFYGLFDGFGHDALIPIWFSKPIAQFGVISLYVRTSGETDISCGFMINLGAVIVLFALPFNETDELLCILFCIRIRKGVTAVVSNLFIVQVFCQCLMSLRLL